MPLVQSTQNAFQLVDRTNEILKLPQSWTLLGDSGLFRDEFLSTSTVTFEERNGALSVIKDQIRGAKPQTRSGTVRKLHAYQTSHHPVEDSVYPQDIAGVIRPGSTNQEVDQEAAAVLRKMVEIERSYAVTKEIAQFKTLSTGNIWAPNGTISANFYSDMGVARNEVNFELATATTDVIDKCNQIVAGFQASANEGQVVSRVVGYASPAFFSALVAHPKVVQTHIYQQIGLDNITQQRAGGMGLYRRLNFGGIEFIEVATVIAGETLVPVKDCVFVAFANDDSFVCYHSPAQRFGYVNTVAERMYAWVYKNERATEITIEAEMGMLNVLRRPNFVSRGYIV